MSKPEQLTDEQRQLVEAHIAWADAGAQRHATRFRGRHPVDELRSAAYLALCRAAMGFEPSRGFVFKTYAMPHTECAMSRVHARDLRQNGGRYAGGGKVVPHVQRVDWPTDPNTGAQVDLPAIGEDPERRMLRQQLRERLFTACLTPFHREVVELRLLGHTNGEIARLVGRSTDVVRYAFNQTSARARRLVEGRAA